MVLRSQLSGENRSKPVNAIIFVIQGGIRVVKSIRNILSACLLSTIIAAGVNAQGGGSPGLVTVLDVAKVFENHPVFKAKMDSLKTEVQAFQQKVRAQVTDLTKKRQQLTQQYKIGTSEFKKEEEQLAREEAELKVKTGQTERDYMDKEARLYYETYVEVQNIVANFSRANNISLVLRFDSNDIDKTNRAAVSQGVNRFIVYQEKLDLTQLIINEVAKKSAQASIQGTGNPK